VSKGKIQKYSSNCIDGVERPFYLYIPSRYDRKHKHPLLVYLHGGVSRVDLIEDYEESIHNNPFTDMAEEQGYIVLYPLGQFGATWWDSVGIANVLQQIRMTKRLCNVDDDRVFMTGFSDGASGSFLFAMKYPSDFAGFMPLNGHPGVASEVGKIQTYMVNMKNRPVHVINTDEDELYPATKIDPIIELAHKAGANIMYRVYTGIGHDFDYAYEEMPRMVTFMETHPRAMNSHIIWETAYQNEGCGWLVIDSIMEQERAHWHDDHNMKLVDDRVMFGFYPDDNFEGIDWDAIDKRVLLQFFPDGDYQGPGVRVDKVVGDSTLCALVGMQDGNVIVKFDDMPINTIEDVYTYKEGKKCGDSVQIVILREGETKEFDGRFPGPITYDLFTRGSPSGRAEAFYADNTFTLSTSRIKAFTLLIHPDMVQLNQNVRVVVNGKRVFDGTVAPSREFILRNFCNTIDHRLLYVNKLTFSIDDNGK
jgi:predicted esterase